MAVRDGLLRNNPTDGVMAEIKKSHIWERTKRHALTVPEQRAFLDYLKSHREYQGWVPVIIVLLGMGMRIGRGSFGQLYGQDATMKTSTIKFERRNYQYEYRKIVLDLSVSDDEQEWFEFKENWFQPDVLGEYVSALSNVAAFHYKKYKCAEVFVYGITDEEFLIVSESLPNNRVHIADCSDCLEYCKEGIAWP